GAHEVAQRPALQTSPSAHATPQPPQFWGSVAKSRQPPSHSVSPPAQTSTQRPSAQASPSAHAAPQPPQCAASASRSTQAPSQAASPSAQTRGASPPPPTTGFPQPESRSAAAPIIARIVRVDRATCAIRPPRKR